MSMMDCASTWSRWSRSQQAMRLPIIWLAGRRIGRRRLRAASRRKKGNRTEIQTRPTESGEIDRAPRRREGAAQMVSGSYSRLPAELLGDGFYVIIDPTRHLLLFTKAFFEKRYHALLIQMIGKDD